MSDSVDHFLVTLVMIAESDGVGLKAASQDGIFDRLRGGCVMPLTQIAIAIGIGRRRLLLYIQEASGC